MVWLESRGFKRRDLSHLENARAAIAAIKCKDLHNMHLSLRLQKTPYVCASCTQRIASASAQIRRYHGTAGHLRGISTIRQGPSGTFPFNIASLSRQPLRNAFSTAATVRGRLRVAIIGSGPAGFYTAYRLMSKNQDAVVDMYEQLPVPYGLVRYGVAPDHPEVKNCQDTFEEVAQSPRFNYIGNVRVGYDIELAKMKPHYDAILFSYGASEDRQLGIPGEDLPGVYSARSFVGWYNALPQFASLKPNLQAGEQAVVIGQGNVALDVARILLSPVDSLRHTDISEQAIQTLSENRVRSVRVVGRRGPIQVRLTMILLEHIAYLKSGCIHCQRSSRADEYPFRRLRPHRPLLVSIRDQEAAPRTETNSGGSTQG